MQTRTVHYTTDTYAFKEEAADLLSVYPGKSF